MERWKDIDTCKGYEVSNTGQIRSKKDLTPVPVKYFKGYKWVVLESNDGHKVCNSIHRFVAKAFIENPLDKPQVNHINGVRADNRVENLEWVTARENLMHARVCLPRKAMVVKKGRNSPRAIPVVQYSITGQIIAEYGAIIEAARSTGVHSGDISSCCSGRRKTAGGFVWKQK